VVHILVIDKLCFAIVNKMWECEVIWWLLMSKDKVFCLFIDYQLLFVW
jgi:hypothetical protein